MYGKITVCAQKASSTSFEVFNEFEIGKISGIACTNVCGQSHSTT